MDKLSRTLKNVKYFLLDMDGTVYLGDKLIGESDKTLDFVRASGRKIIYLTNNSSKTLDEYESKLRRLNLFRDGDRVYSSGVAAKDFLLRNRKGKSVCLLGTDAFKRELTESGICITDKNPDICLLSYDTELTYKKLCNFTDGLFGGAEYIATHPDMVCPADGYSVLDAGAFIYMIKTAVGREPQIVIGKPFSGMGDELKSNYNAAADEFIMVGDRVYTDIAFGVGCGFHTLFVLSGEGTIADAEAAEKQPEFTLDSINEIVNYL